MFFCATVAEVGFPQIIGPEHVEIKAHLGNACTTQLPGVSDRPVVGPFEKFVLFLPVLYLCMMGLGGCILQDSSCLSNVEHVQILKRTRHSSTGWSMTNSLKMLPAGTE